MKIATIIGARPQFIKAATVSRLIRNRNDVSEILVHTGQHYDDNMSKVFFDELEIPKPDYNLGIGGGNHGAMTGRQLEAIESVLLKEKPDRVLVYGDTNSTLAGALAAVKLHIPVAHVEAGLRSFNRAMPEEINRVLTDHAADLLFAPTETAVKNLSSEGLMPKTRQTGDVMFDAALFYAEKALTNSSILTKIGLASKNYVLATLHRAENTDDDGRMRDIVAGLLDLSTEIPIVLPLHPRTENVLKKLNLLTTLAKQIQVIDPVGYLDMVMLEKNANLIVTDSGGVQKEAFFHSVPCLTLRDETEWVELVELGWNQLVAVNDLRNLKEFSLQAMNSKGEKISPYGSGKAAHTIVQYLTGN